MIIMGMAVMVRMGMVMRPVLPVVVMALIASLVAVVVVMSMGMAVPVGMAVAVLPVAVRMIVFMVMLMIVAVFMLVEFDFHGFLLSKKNLWPSGFLEKGSAVCAVLLTQYADVFHGFQ